MTPARAGTSAVAAVLGATVLLLVLVTWAASIGPDDVLRGPGIAAGTSFVPSPTTSDQPGGVADVQEQARLKHADDGPPPLWYRFLAVVVELALAGVALFLLTRVARNLLDRWRARRRPLERSQAVVDFEVLGRRAGPRVGDPGRRRLAAHPARDGRAAQRDRRVLGPLRDRGGAGRRTPPQLADRLGVRARGARAGRRRPARGGAAGRALPRGALLRPRAHRGPPAPGLRRARGHPPLAARRLGRVAVMAREAGATTGARPRWWSRWWPRALLAALLYGAALVTATLLKDDPDPVRLALVVAVLVATGSLLLDAAAVPAATWPLAPTVATGLGRADPPHGGVPPGPGGTPHVGRRRRGAA